MTSILASSINYFFYGEGAQAPSSLSSGYSNQDMRRVWQQTKRDLDRGFYTLKGKQIQLGSEIRQAAKSTLKRTGSIWRWFIQLLFGKTYSSLGYNTKVEVINRDAIEVAIDHSKKFKTALLNPANAWDPGGGYRQGSRAMEEDICRRSGLAMAIHSIYKRVCNFYPLRGSELLFTTDVPVFRKGRAGHYAYLKKPEKVSVITSAAIDLNPNHRTDKKYLKGSTAYVAETKRRIYEQLSAAADQGIEAVVLTAFGCGAFRNRPEVVAQLYKEAIDTHFQGVFKKIVFAVIDDHNTRRHSHNPRGNLKPFQEVFA